MIRDRQPKVRGKVEGSHSKALNIENTRRRIALLLCHSVQANKKNLCQDDQHEVKTRFFNAPWAQQHTPDDWNNGIESLPCSLSPRSSSRCVYYMAVESSELRLFFTVLCCTIYIYVLQKDLPQEAVRFSTQCSEWYKTLQCIQYTQSKERCSRRLEMATHMAPGQESEEKRMHVGAVQSYCLDKAPEKWTSFG